MFHRDPMESPVAQMALARAGALWERSNREDTIMRRHTYALLTVATIAMSAGTVLSLNLFGARTAIAEAIKPVEIVNTAADPVPVFGEVTVGKNLVSDGQAFALPPNPNPAIEIVVPDDVVLTDVVVALNSPSLATTYFVIGRYASTSYVYESVGSAGSTWAGNTTGRAATHFQSGLQDPAGFRIGITCNNIGGNSCAGSIMWSGYVP